MEKQPDEFVRTQSNGQSFEFAANDRYVRTWKRKLYEKARLIDLVLNEMDFEFHQGHHSTANGRSWRNYPYGGTLLLKNSDIAQY